MKISNIEVAYIDHCGDDLSVVRAARVSFDKESDWENNEFGHPDFELPNYLKAGDVKLINYLAKHKHKSPFNHSFISVRVKAPVFVARQLVKHKFLPWNEVSRRYVDSEPEFYVPEVWRGKAENVKQGSADTRAEGVYIEEYDNESGWCSPSLDEMSKFHTEESLRLYTDLLKQGACAEQARMVLPQSVMTEWIWSGTLGAFADMLVLRLSSYTQAETREVAQQVKDIVEPLFPVSLKALLEHS